MTNPFKYDKAKNEIWEDYPAPNKYEYGSTLTELRRFENTLANYNTRPHFTVSPEPDWEDGKIVRQDIDFKIRWSNGLAAWQGDRSHKDDVEIAIPLPKEAEIDEYVDNWMGSMEKKTTQKPKPEQQDIPMGKIAQAFIDAYKEFNPNMKESHEDILNRIAIRAAKNILSMFPQSPKEEKES